MTAQYQVSLMHRSVVTRAVVSVKHGYVLTASHDGMVKFWKRVPIDVDSSGPSHPSSAASSTAAAGATTTPCLEFVKSYTAHVGPVGALVVSHTGDAALSAGTEDGVLKLYDVSSFDVTAMIRVSFPAFSQTKRQAQAQAQAQAQQLGCHAAFLGVDATLVAISSASSGEVYIFDTQTLSPHPVKCLTQHTRPLTGMAYNPIHQCMLTTDGTGAIELWDCSLTTSSSDSGTPAASMMEREDDVQESSQDNSITEEISGVEYPELGLAATGARNGIVYSSKMMDTDLYELVRKKTCAIAVAWSPTGTHFAVYGKDRKIRLWHHASGKCVVTYDERPKVYDKQLLLSSKKSPSSNGSSSSSSSSMDAIEYGKRAATEREMNDTPIFSGGTNTSTTDNGDEDDDVILSRDSAEQLMTIQFDETGKYLLIPTILGIKVIDWARNKVVSIVGKSDASSLRFVSFVVCPGDAKVDRQMQLARTGGSSTAMNHDDKDHAIAKLSDALLVALAYKKRRLFVFSHVDPLMQKMSSGSSSEEQSAALMRRDVLNEPPDADDLMLSNIERASQQQTHDNTALGKEAILRTTMGDIHMKLFASEVPKTVENFCGLARKGYYDNITFHRIIKGFMLQTGDPEGDGTGGESLWGGEFEDEFVRDLRHDRPFTVSMANAGPNTNGSQFFITTVPTPWLDNKHTVFGRVTKGMSLCTSIENVKTDRHDKPLDEISILSVDIL